MTRWTRIVPTLAAFALLATPVARAQGTPPNMFDEVAEARTVLALLGEGKFGEVEARFSPEMAQALPAGQLATAWASISAQVGKLTALGEPRVEDRAGARIVIFPATYERANLNLIVAWTADHKLVGLLAQPRS